MPPIFIFVTVGAAFANDDNAKIYCEVEYWCKVQPQKSTVETRRELLELSNYCDKTTLVTLPIFANTSTAGYQHCKTRSWHFLLFSLSDWSFEMFHLWTESQIPLLSEDAIVNFCRILPSPCCDWPWITNVKTLNLFCGVLVEYQSVATPSALSAVIECDIFLQAWVQGSIGCKCGESGGLMGLQ